MVSICACRIQHLQKADFFGWINHPSSPLLANVWVYTACLIPCTHLLLEPYFSKTKFFSYDPEQYICWTRIKTPCDNRYILIIYYIYIILYIYICIHKHIHYTFLSFSLRVPPTNSPPLFRFLIKLDGFSEAPKPNAGPHKLRECLPLIVPGTSEIFAKKFST